MRSLKRRILQYKTAAHYAAPRKGWFTKPCRPPPPRTPMQLPARWMVMVRLITISPTDSAFDPESAHPTPLTHVNTLACSCCEAASRTTSAPPCSWHRSRFAQAACDLLPDCDGWHNR